MWVKRWWRYVRGEVRFRAEGGLCERFLNLLSEGERPVRLWNIDVGEGTVTASCRASDYGKMRPFARRTGTRVRSVYYRGAAKRLRPLRRHPGVIVGVMLATVMYTWLAARIWVVEVVSPDPALQPAVLQVLEESGIGIGLPAKTVDLAAVRMKVIAALPQVHHVSVYLDGCVARVDVTLADGDIVLPDNEPANVVARRDGLIVSMRVSQGEKVAKVGEAVVAGDLLVCGATETAGGVLFRHAKAQITAQTEHVLTATACRTETVPVSGRVRVCPTLRFLSLSVPLYATGADVKAWDVSCDTRSLSLFGTTLPVSLETVTYTEPLTRSVTYTAAETEALANGRLQTLLGDLERDAQIIDTVIQTQWEGDVCRVTATVTALEDIALEQPMLLTQGINEDENAYTGVS